MSSDVYWEEVEALTMDILLPIRDFVIRHGTSKQPGRDLISIGMDKADEERKIIIDVQKTTRCLSMRITIGEDTRPEDFHMLVFRGEGNCLFIDRAVNPSDIITLSIAIQAGESLFDTSSKTTLH